MPDPIAVNVVRGDIVESVHTADAAVVDEAGRPVDSAGDPLAHAAFRSSAKPLQAGVLLDLGWRPSGAEQLAIASASHNGEPNHVSVVDAILGGAGLTRDVLRCPEALPHAALPHVVAAAGPPARILHNCSGKHAAMLAACVTRGWPLETYREHAHPLQQAIHEAIEQLAGSLLETATDGCGVVTFGAPLTALARAFGAVRADPPFAEAGAAMREHPFLVAGTGRLDTALMRAFPDLVVKSGAEGLVCAAGPSFAVAAKIRDGASRAAGPVVLELLRRVGYLPDPLPETLTEHAKPPVMGGGRRVGELRVRA